MEPMLASAAKKALKFPLLASPKLDGIRAWHRDGKLLSRRMKEFPNADVNRLFGDERFADLDGEFIIGSPTDPEAFRKTTSVVMSKDKQAFDLVLWVFDDLSGGAHIPFKERLRILKLRAKGLPNVKIVEQVLVKSEEELTALEEKWLQEGYEGAMVRSLDGIYKFGRSTENEGHLLKVKRFEDCEAKILDLEELDHNLNEKEVSETGRSKRSSKKEGKVAAGTLGALVVEGVNGTYKGVKFNVGAGFTQAVRDELWAEGSKLKGRIITVKYFPSGSKDRPRFPVFKGFRNVEVDG